MTALAVALVAVIAAQVGLVVWLVHRAVSATNLHADERVAHTATNGLLERTAFELATVLKANAEQQRVIDGLEEVLANYINSNPNSGLAPGDVLSRLVQAAKQQAASRDGALPASPEGGVSEEPASRRPDSALMSPDDTTDVQR